MQKTLRNNNDKGHAKSFSSQQSKTPKKVVEPLTRAFFTHLIKLETDFYNKQYTAEALDELTQLYAKAVEYYDTIKDEITSYFIYKIQDALASKKSLKLLLDQTAKEAVRKSTIASSDAIPEGGLVPKIEEVDIKNEVIKENVSEENSEDDEDDVNVKEFEKKRRAYLGKRNNRDNKASFSTMRNQKQKFVQFFHKIEVQKVNQKQNLNTLLEDYGSSAKDNDMTVKGDLLKQKERFRDMLEQRKQKTLMTHTLNASSQFSALRTSMQNGSKSHFKKEYDANRLEDVLKGLEEDEDARFEAAGLLAGDQPNQNEEEQINDGDIRSVSEKTPRDIARNPKEKHAIFKAEAIDFSLPARIGDDEKSNTDIGSFAFLSPRDAEVKSSKVLSEDSNRVADGGNDANKAQVIETDSVCN